MGKEILTIQLGHRANYLATHFWNSQEANFDYDDTNEKPIINHDVHFRAGVGHDGVETYTPRTLIYDLKGGFGNLRKYNELYETVETESVAWEGNVQTYSEPIVPVNPYQTALGSGAEDDLLTTDKVRWWSDFNRVYYHPRSAIQLNQYQLDMSAFDSYTQGRELFHEIDTDADILDRDVRPFVEESDSLQGFQVLMESDSSWAGFGSDYLESLRGEYPKASIWTWGIESNNVNSTRRLTFAQTIASVYENVSLYIPLVQPPRRPSSISIDPSSYWHVSALYSLAYDSITLPTRTRAEHPFHMEMDDICNRVNIHGQRKFADSDVAVLFDQANERDLLSLGWLDIPGERGLTATVFRGDVTGDIDALTKSMSRGNIVTERILHPQPLKVPTSFPKIFPDHHAKDMSLSTFSSLSSKPSTAKARLKWTAEDARRLSSTEEREDLYNSISEISSYFEEDDDFE